MPLLFDTPGVYWGGMKYKEEGMERINAWTTYKKREEKKVMDLGKAYRAYLDSGKTKRECARETIGRAEKAGYVDLGPAVHHRQRAFGEGPQHRGRPHRQPPDGPEAEPPL